MSGAPGRAPQLLFGQRGLIRKTYKPWREYKRADCPNRLGKRPGRAMAGQSTGTSFTPAPGRLSGCRATACRQNSIQRFPDRPGSGAAHFALPSPARGSWLIRSDGVRQHPRQLPSRETTMLQVPVAKAAAAAHPYTKASSHLHQTCGSCQALCHRQCGRLLSLC